MKGLYYRVLLFLFIRESVRLTQLWCGLATRTSVVIDGLFGGAGLPIVMPRCAIKNEKSWEHEPWLRFNSH